MLFAGRLQPLKGPDLAIAALGQVPEELRPHLVVAGEVSQQKQVRELLDETRRQIYAVLAEKG